MNECEVCKKEARQFCSSCKLAFYCSRECQKKSWKTHKLNCQVFAIETNPIYGRYAVATRNIQAGETIIKEAPLVIGPKIHSAPICLGCHSPLANAKICCKRCNYPLCSSDCENSKYHESECGILAKASTTVKIMDVSDAHPAYESITPLRCLLQKKGEASKWEKILKLQSNEKEIKATNIYKVNKANIVNFIRIFLGYKEADEDLIHRICGVLITNAFEIIHNGKKMRGLYYNASLLAHSCVPNTKHVFDGDFNVIFKATKEISKGEIIYTTYTPVLWDTMSRQFLVKMTKFFTCTCDRCKDPTELGTDMSTLFCTKCSGYAYSTDPLNSDAEWKCIQCDNTLLGRQVKFGNEMLNQELRRGREYCPTSLENFIDNYKGTLHPHHRFMLEAKYALIKYYGNSDSCPYKDLTKQQKENKEKWCRELLQILEVINPGQSLLMETVLTKLQAVQNTSSKQKLSNGSSE